MKLYEIMMISLSLAMDAFSVSLSKGINMKYKVKRNSFLLCISFSIFQMIMPLIGYFLGNKLNNYFLKFNYLIAAIILLVIGFNMIKDNYNDNDINYGLNIKELIGLSIATSIDALAVGITFSLFNNNLLLTIIIIGIITLFMCCLGILIGKYIGIKYQNKSSLLGGIILIIIGLKFLIQNYFN